MGIVAFCPHGHRINVKASLAGKKGLCPTCGAKFRIPAAAGGAQPPSAHGLPTADLLEMAADLVASLPRALPFAAASPEPGTPPPPRLHPVLAARPDLEWRVAFPGGEPTEPMSSQAMQAWLESGRLAGEEVVWRADWPEWRPARDVFRRAGSSGAGLG